MNRGKKALIVICSIILAIAVAGGVWHAVVRVQSNKVGLITLDTSELPEPVLEPSEDNFVQLSEVNMHYQIFSTGDKEPLVLIHGNGGGVWSLREAAQYLANDYTVYLIESRCQGDSSDPGEISYSLMASDVAEFIKAVGLVKPIVMGHSDGGMVAITLAAEHPDVPGKIISCGANSNPKTFKHYMTLETKVEALFKHDKLIDMMLEQPQCWTPEYLGQIKCPAYIVAAEFDINWLSDTVYIHENIPGSDVAIVKLANHGSYMSQNGKKAYVLARDWLSKQEQQ